MQKIINACPSGNAGKIFSQKLIFFFDVNNNLTCSQEKKKT